MKKWTKTALLTGCACCIAGAVLMFSGWASGTSFRPVTIPVISPGGFRRKKERLQWNIACGTVF